MNDYNANEENDSGREQTEIETEAETLCIERNDELMGALELEYPGATLYRDIFREYAPEIADWLVSHRSVRYLVEVTYNCYVVGELLFDAPGVTEQTAFSVLAMAERLTNLLDRVCVQMADVYRVEHRYPSRGEMQ